VVVVVVVVPMALLENQSQAQATQTQLLSWMLVLVLHCLHKGEKEMLLFGKEKCNYLQTRVATLLPQSLQRKWQQQTLVGWGFAAAQLRHHHRLDRM
jgi:hypothetical protein